MPVFPLVMGWPVRNRGSISSILDLPRYIRAWAYWAPWDRFFAEAQVNEDVLPEQYPFTMAHEFAHLLGVGSEAEANYFAFLVCMQSDSDAMRYKRILQPVALCGGQCQEVIVR